MPKFGKICRFEMKKLVLERLQTCEKTAGKSDDPIFENCEQRSKLRETAQKRKLRTTRRKDAVFAVFTSFLTFVSELRKFSGRINDRFISQEMLCS